MLLVKINLTFRVARCQLHITTLFPALVTIPIMHMLVVLMAGNTHEYAYGATFVQLNGRGDLDHILRQCFFAAT